MSSQVISLTLLWITSPSTQHSVCNVVSSLSLIQTLRVCILMVVLHLRNQQQSGEQTQYQNRGWKGLGNCTTFSATVNYTTTITNFCLQNIYIYILVDFLHIPIFPILLPISLTYSMRVSKDGWEKFVWRRAYDITTR